MEEVEVVYKGKKYKVVLGKITYRQRNMILDKCTETVIDNGKPRAKLKYGILEREVVVASIKKIEPPVNDVGAFVDDLDYDEAMKLVRVAMRLNPLLT